MWLSAYEHMLSLEIEKIIPGHGPLLDKSNIEEHYEFHKKLKEVVKTAIKEGKGPTEIKVPDFKYEPAADWQITRALEFLHNFYSK